PGARKPPWVGPPMAASSFARVYQHVPFRDKRRFPPYGVLMWQAVTSPSNTIGRLGRGDHLASCGFYEFFAGAGLVRLALSPEWRVLWANDISPKKRLVYVQNFGEDQFVLGDIADVFAEDLPKGGQMAWASFPCEDLSLAGWRRG